MTGTRVCFAVRLVSILFWLTTPSAARELLVGVANADITPTGPVALREQARQRIARKVETPILANVLVLESRDGDPKTCSRLRREEASA